MRFTSAGRGCTAGDASAHAAGAGNAAPGGLLCRGTQRSGPSAPPALENVPGLSGVAHPAPRGPLGHRPRTHRGHRGHKQDTEQGGSGGVQTSVRGTPKSAPDLNFSTEAARRIELLYRAWQSHDLLIWDSHKSWSGPMLAHPWERRGSEMGVNTSYQSEKGVQAPELVMTGSAGGASAARGSARCRRSRRRL